MAHHEEKQVDAVTGMTKTGHSWDGIEELNTPLPKWWLYMFYATIIWSIGYWVVYPSWPLVQSYTVGAFNWHSRSAVEEELQGLKTLRGPMTQKLAAASVDEVIANNEKDPELYNFAVAMGKAAFADNCAPCHGSGAQGSFSYPNLNDDEWLWGGTPEEIYTTIKVGVRSTSPETHSGVMTAFGRDGLLDPTQIANVTDYIRAQNDLPVDAKADLDAGKVVFEENCTVCHGDNGMGMKELGTPNLFPRVVDGKKQPKIWLYSSDREQIIRAVTNGQGNVMPTWEGRLDDTTIKALAVYVVNFGGAVLPKN
ncbi:cytochrome-c oxidase, cbb3-type subunit III [Microvirga sp. W0021]|uniref:Cbb3-type cytochrome c oxidase subunit n=1 Tax=Hohaiivirga grylli TaxID=3133970 RepID=A0ABV0BL42_9HYPH